MHQARKTIRALGARRLLSGQEHGPSDGGVWPTFSEERER
jgi:hypothetical protein